MNHRIRQIANRFDIKPIAKISRFGNGLINDTYLVQSDEGKFILQKLHTIFKPTLLTDIHNITKYLSENNQITPLIVKTKDKKLYLTIGKNDYWRMLTYIPGVCHESGINAGQIFSAGCLVGRFHQVLSNFEYKFKHKIKHFTSPAARINRLEQVLKRFKRTEKYKNLFDLARYTLQEYMKLGCEFDSMPDRIVHGDLKINNIRFDGKGNAICLLDLDTLGRYKTIADIAEATRTWCNKSNEDDVLNSKFDAVAFKKLMRGYLTTAKFLTKKEIALIPEAIKRTILVLTARFITDAFEEKYFRLVRGRYKNLYEQNKTKAEAQLTLYGDFLKKENQINKIIKDLMVL